MRLIAIVCLLGALGLVGTWVAHGTHLATLTKRMVEKTVTDEFGDTVKTTSWEPTFEIGLDYAGPGAGGLLLVSAVLFFRSRRRDTPEA